MSPPRVYGRWDHYPVTGDEIREAVGRVEDRGKAVHQLSAEIRKAQNAANASVAGDLHDPVADAPKASMKVAEKLGTDSVYAAGCLRLWALGVDTFDAEVNRLNSLLTLLQHQPAYRRGTIDRDEARAGTIRYGNQEYAKAVGDLDTAAETTERLLKDQSHSHIRQLMHLGCLPLNAAVYFPDVHFTNKDYAKAVQAKVAAGVLPDFTNMSTDEVKQYIKSHPHVLPGLKYLLKGSGGAPGGFAFVPGPPVRPSIKWDEDFKYNSDDPTFQDYVSRAEWLAKLKGGQLFRSDLDDATQMYAHYWDNNGEPIEFDYAEAAQEDPGIRRAINSEIARAQWWADVYARSGRQNFSITGDASPTAADEYPQTENWQKTIGGYQQWSSADVHVEGNKVTMVITVHAEDHYNFNRGQQDIATGASDNENGRFQEVGWAKSFDSHGSVKRTVTWTIGHPGGGHDDPDSYDPQRNPGREDREDGRNDGSGGPRWPDNNRDTGHWRGT